MTGKGGVRSSSTICKLRDVQEKGPNTEMSLIRMSTYTSSGIAFAFGQELGDDAARVENDGKQARGSGKL